MPYKVIQDILAAEADAYVNPTKFKNLLGDFGHLLSIQERLALQMVVSSELSSRISASEVASSEQITVWVNEFCENTGIQYQAGLWSVEMWARALGKIDREPVGFQASTISNTVDPKDEFKFKERLFGYLVDDGILDVVERDLLLEKSNDISLSPDIRIALIAEYENKFNKLRTAVFLREMGIGKGDDVECRKVIESDLIVKDVQIQEWLDNSYVRVKMDRLKQIIAEVLANSKNPLESDLVRSTAYDLGFDESTLEIVVDYLHEPFKVLMSSRASLGKYLKAYFTQIEDYESQGNIDNAYDYGESLGLEEEQIKDVLSVEMSKLHIKLGQKAKIRKLLLWLLIGLGLGCILFTLLYYFNQKSEATRQQSLQITELLEEICGKPLPFTDSMVPCYFEDGDGACLRVRETSLQLSYAIDSNMIRLQSQPLHFVVTKPRQTDATVARISLGLTSGDTLVSSLGMKLEKSVTNQSLSMITSGKGAFEHNVKFEIPLDEMSNQRLQRLLTAISNHPIFLGVKPISIQTPMKSLIVLSSSAGSIKPPISTKLTPELMQAIPESSSSKSKTTSQPEEKSVVSLMLEHWFISILILAGGLGVVGSLVERQFQEAIGTFFGLMIWLIIIRACSDEGVSSKDQTCINRKLNIPVINVRAEKTSSSRVVGELHRGDGNCQVSLDGEWAEFKLSDGKYGYVRTKFFEPVNSK